MSSHDLVFYFNCQLSQRELFTEKQKWIAFSVFGHLYLSLVFFYFRLVKSSVTFSESIIEDQRS